MRKKITVIIGKNFGDEGKGLVTDYFAGQTAGAQVAGCDSGRASGTQSGAHFGAIVIKHNGGAQAGHTVDRPDRRFVFHQLSSGSFHGVPTFLSETFLPDLLKLPGEAEDFRRVNGRVPPILIDGRCRLTTVFDVVLNAFAESERGRSRHGSCGMGINEAVTRSGNPEFALSLEEFASFSPREAGLFLDKIRTGYVPARLRELSLKMRNGDRWCELLQDRNVAYNAADAMKSGLPYISIVRDAKALLRDTEQLIFEGAQGLLLDRNNLTYMPYLTPSDTGSRNPFELLTGCGIPFDRDNSEICYVTRSYVTRHGAGPLPYECGREDIASGICDETNTENPWQESLRYARHPSGAEFAQAIGNDRVHYENARDRETRKGTKVSLMVTHLNETGGKILCAGDGARAAMEPGAGRCDETAMDPGAEGLRSLFDHIYTSDTPYAADIRRIK